MSKYELITMVENSSSSKMVDIIDAVRSCNLNCYVDRYKSPLNTKKRTITVNELLQGRPLIDDWDGQKILFISQAPSRQAWADHKLSSLENSFFKNQLIEKVFPHSLPTKEAFKIWKKTVFWTHTANCYPGSNNAGEDKLPDSTCADKYLDQIINNMNPKLIVLMGLSSTKFFDISLRELIGSKKAPSLKEILNWQKENQSTLWIKSKNGNSKYKAVVIRHAAYRWGKPTDSSKFGYELASRLIRETYNDFR